jgi:hypothetical protein
MGAVNFSLDIDLVKEVKKKFLLDVFIETGTFKGDTIENVKDIFKNIYSVEISNEYFKLASEKFKAFPNIKIFESSSPAFIKSLKNEFINKSVLFWLDAHWCVADHTGGEESQCPLIEELEAIGQLNEESLIVIDDARLFLTVPPYPHEVSHWPSLNQIVNTLRNLSSKHEIMVLNDNILFFPETAKALIYEYAHRHSIDWLNALDKARDYDKLLNQLKEKNSLINEQAVAQKEKDALIEKQDAAQKEKDALLLAQDAAQKEKDALIHKHHKFAHELMDELKKRNIQFTTQWPSE